MQFLQVLRARQVQPLQEYAILLERQNIPTYGRHTATEH